MEPPISHLGHAGGLDVGAKGEYVTLGYPGEAHTFSPHVAIGLAALLRTAARLALKERAAAERRRAQ